MSLENLIETKKSINETGSTPESPPDYIGFLKAEGKNIITTFIYYLVSGCIVLYLTKLSFANVLPMNFPEIPYKGSSETKGGTAINIPFADMQQGGATDQNGTEKNNIVETNIVKIGGFLGLGAKEILSTKIEFDAKKIDELYETGLIGFLRKTPYNPKKATIFGNFFGKVFCDIVKTNNWLITQIFSKFYSYLTESIIIILAPMVMGFCFAGLYMFNFLCFIIFYISNIGLIFREVKIEDNTVNYTDLDFENGFGWLWCFLNAIIWFILFAFGLTVMPVFMMLYSLFSPLAISAKNVTQDKEKTKMGFGDFCKDVIYYKGQLFLALLSFGLIGPAKTYLGSSGFAACIVAILFCILGLHLYNLSYNPKTDTNLTPSLAPNKIVGGGYKKPKKTRKNNKGE